MGCVLLREEKMKVKNLMSLRPRRGANCYIRSILGLSADEAVSVPVGVRIVTICQELMAFWDSVSVPVGVRIVTLKRGEEKA